jgi:hypothetical protein
MNRFLPWMSLLMLAGCGANGPAPRHTVLAGNLAPLRSQFNADAGKVRAVFLASPT